MFELSDLRGVGDLYAAIAIRASECRHYLAEDERVEIRELAEPMLARLDRVVALRVSDKAELEQVLQDIAFIVTLVGGDAIG